MYSCKDIEDSHNVSTSNLTHQCLPRNGAIDCCTPSHRRIVRVQLQACTQSSSNRLCRCRAAPYTTRLSNPLPFVKLSCRPWHTSQIHTKACMFSTDSQYSDPLCTSVCVESSVCAAGRGSWFIPIVLTCSEEANLERLISSERGLHHKLVCGDTVRKVRQESEVHVFERHPKLLTMDVTTMKPIDAAKAILDHIL